MLDEKLRVELKKPFGQLCKASSCSEKLNNFDKIISVGDITTYEVLQCGVVPDICIVDGITMREKVSDEIRSRIDTEPYDTLTVDNPAGSISEELIEGITKAIGAVKKSKRVKLVVHGEEDLAVIPAVIEAPRNTAVLYGQPGEGMVIIRVTSEKKKRAKQLLKMIVVQ